jgi:hypothetical protein
MTLSEMLNSQMDLGSFVAVLRQGLTWWADELTAMLPKAWRDRLSSRPRLWIEPQSSGGWRIWRDGRLLGQDAPLSDPRARVGLLAPPDAVLIRELPAPRMTLEDVRRLFSLDIDRLSPLAPGLIYFDIEIIHRGDAERGQRVRLGILQRAQAARLLSQARDAGYTPSALAVRPSDGEGLPCFDFLPRVLEATGETGDHRLRLYAWLGAAVLIILNLAVLVGRDMADVTRLNSMVEAQRPVVGAVMRLRHRLEAEDARRRDLVALGQRNEPLKMLGALTDTLPAGAWVQHLEWNGQTLHLVGYRRQDIDLPAALRRSGVFINPRVLTPDPATGPSLARAFDIAVDNGLDRRP